MLVKFSSCLSWQWAFACHAYMHAMHVELSFHVFVWYQFVKVHTAWIPTEVNDRRCACMCTVQCVCLGCVMELIERTRLQSPVYPQADG